MPLAPARALLGQVSLWLVLLSLVGNLPPPDSPRSPGWRPLERCSMPLPPPSPSDDLRPPPPTAVAPWAAFGCFGTGARVAGSILLAGPTAASCQPLVLALSFGEEEGGAGWEWQSCPSSGHGRGATLHMLALSPSSSPDGGSWGGALCLFLRHRPLTTSAAPLLPPSRSRSEAVNLDLAPGVESGKRTGREWQVTDPSMDKPCQARDAWQCILEPPLFDFLVTPRCFKALKGVHPTTAF
ncbi:hypothetical protein EDB83DRAFT_2327655 [Lactarius deliciosus]|nr:hypothetical protein EDB83DRAFT_2327655 [Lactarius deliciosus]